MSYKGPGYLDLDGYADNYELSGYVPPSGATGIFIVLSQITYTFVNNGNESGDYDVVRGNITTSYNNLATAINLGTSGVVTYDPHPSWTAANLGDYSLFTSILNGYIGDIAGYGFTSNNESYFTISADDLGSESTPAIIRMTPSGSPQENNYIVIPVLGYE